MTEDKQGLLNAITNDLKQVDGVKAIVLGGSYAMDMATESSDLDIGIYYLELYPFDIEKIRSVATKYSTGGQPTVTGFYEWGPWVNGGAWIDAASGEVDFLYKNIDQIKRTIDNAHHGIWENNYEQQPPYGFSSIIYLAETQHCLPLYDPDHILKELKESAKVYPKKLKESVIQQALWSAEFTIWQAEKFAVKKDTYNTLGCLTRAIKGIVMALFAMNELYPMGDQRAVNLLARAKISPRNLELQIDKILYCSKDSLKEHVALLRNLLDQVIEFADGAYRPYYKL